MARTKNRQMLAELLAAQRRHRCPTAKVRINVIVLTQRGEHSATQIAQRCRVARSTVFAYRRLYRQRGIDGLLRRLGPGRPSHRPSSGLEQVIVRGLRLMQWFHLRTLQNWIRHHNHVYPDWTVRRWALELIERLKIFFPVDWRSQRLMAFDVSQRSDDRWPAVSLRWNKQSIHPPLQTTLELLFDEGGRSLGYVAA